MSLGRKEVAGIPLRDLKEATHVALDMYQHISNGEVQFDMRQAVQLELTPDKPNSARSDTPVKHLGEVAGTLFVIAFAPDDGTGDYNSFPAGTLNTGKYPVDSKYSPRKKAGAHSEAHISLVSKLVDAPAQDPELFAGHLDVLGVVTNPMGGTITRLGHVGQDAQAYKRTMEQALPARPNVTLTTGYRGVLDTIEGRTGDRFGDPHAILNNTPNTVQVAGFIAISPEMASRHLDALRSLGAVEPKLLA